MTSKQASGVSRPCFLASCGLKRIELRNCPAFLRERSCERTPGCETGNLLNRCGSTVASSIRMWSAALPYDGIFVETEGIVPRNTDFSRVLSNR